MKTRLDLREDLLAIEGVTRLYWQPPPTVQMKYPCVLYKLDGEYTRFGDNRRYAEKNRYQLIVVDPNPDSNIADNILHTLPYCRFDRRYTADNLNHTVLTLFY